MTPTERKVIVVTATNHIIELMIEWQKGEMLLGDLGTHIKTHIDNAITTALRASEIVIQ